MRVPWRVRAALFLGILSVATAGLQAVQTLSGKRRDECTLESQRLYHCASYSAADSILTDKQKELCCEALQNFNWSGCFCGWGRAADMNPWTRDVLGDLACAFRKCSAGFISCMADEEYLQNSDAERGYNGPEMQALKSATRAVSRMVDRDGWSVAKPKSFASSVQSLVDLRRGGGSEDSRTGLTEAYAVGSGDFDIKVEVEQDGGDDEDLSATVKQLSRWIGALLDKARVSVNSDRTGFFGRRAYSGSAAADLDRMDRTDTLGSVLAHVMDLITSLVNGTDAQVDVAVEITIETTTTTGGGMMHAEPKQALAIAKAEPLIHRAIIPAGADPSRSMRIERITSETVSGLGEQQAHPPHCLLQRIARAAAANPAGLFAVLAATAFLFLAATFICQLVYTIVCEVQRQMMPGDEEDPMVENPLLSHDLTAPLLSADGEPHEGFQKSKPQQC